MFSFLVSLSGRMLSRIMQPFVSYCLAKMALHWLHMQLKLRIFQLFVAGTEKNIEKKIATHAATDALLTKH